MIVDEKNLQETCWPTECTSFVNVVVFLFVTNNTKASLSRQFARKMRFSLRSLFAHCSLLFYLYSHFSHFPSTKPLRKFIWLQLQKT